MPKHSTRFLLAGLLVAMTLSTLDLHASPQSRALLTERIDETDLVTLVGNTRPEANARNDRGAVSASYPLHHMQLVLRRPPETEQALDQFLEELNDPKSPNFHQWLNAREFGERFGLAADDIHTLKDWLESRGFSVDVIYDSGVLIDFTGTAGQVKSAFHTEIHNLQVAGQKHIANMSDPKIPAALAPAVIGVASLHNFFPHPLVKPAPEYNSGTSHYLAPPDMETIYNLNPLFAAGITGKGRIVAVVEDTDLAGSAYPNLNAGNGPWNVFRKIFGLARAFPYGTMAQIEPQPTGSGPISYTGSNNCADAGINGDDTEAILDVEWVSASAPNATVWMITCADTEIDFGAFLGVQNLINSAGPYPDTISVSYGESEAEDGAAYNAYTSQLYQQAATEGVSVFASSGDEGGDSSDADLSLANEGLSVSGLTSTPYNVSVGGTDFEDTYNARCPTTACAGGGPPVSTYWSSSNSANLGSALSYVPEIPWNDSCGEQIYAYYVGFANGATYGANGWCNSSYVSALTRSAGGSGYTSAPTCTLTGGGFTVAATCTATIASGAVVSPLTLTSGGYGYTSAPTCTLSGGGGTGATCTATKASNGSHSPVAGSGGFSSCASGAPDPNYPGIVSGTCAGFVKPSWQAGILGNPSDGVRDVPDVSLFASQGQWGHALVYCTSSCPTRLGAAGGTSFSSPIMSGIQALVNQYTGERWGNPNPYYYAIANAQFNNSLAACNSSRSGGPASTCVFNDITQGDLDMACPNGTQNCYNTSGAYGALSTGPTALSAGSIALETIPFPGGTVVTAPGGGYNGTPTCTITAAGGGPGSGATCTAAFTNPTAVQHLIITNAGTGYTSNPTCAITGGGGTGATCTATRTAAIQSLSITSGGSGYTLAPNCAITGGGGSGAICTLTLAGGAVSTIYLMAAGSGYTSVPTCTISGGTGSGATCVANALGVTSLTLSAGGSGYTSNPTCALSGGGGTGATCSATADGVTGVTLTNAGSGYTAPPDCTISGGGGSGATCGTYLGATTFAAAYPTNPGWDFATGIGSVNAYNLVMSSFWTTPPCTVHRLEKADGVAVPKC